MRKTRPRIILAAALVVLVCSSGCVRNNAVLVPSGTPIQLAEDVEAYVYIYAGGKYVKSDNRVKLAHGWWVLSDDPDANQ